MAINDNAMTCVMGVKLPCNAEDYTVNGGSSLGWSYFGDYVAAPAQTVAREMLVWRDTIDD